MHGRCSLCVPAPTPAGVHSRSVLVCVQGSRRPRFPHLTATHSRLCAALSETVKTPSCDKFKEQFNHLVETCRKSMPDDGKSQVSQPQKAMPKHAHPRVGTGKEKKGSVCAPTPAGMHAGTNMGASGARTRERRMRMHARARRLAGAPARAP